MKRSAETSCIIRALGKNQRSSGPAGVLVAALRGGGHDSGMSGVMLYQNFGISSTGRSTRRLFPKTVTHMVHFLIFVMVGYISMSLLRITVQICTFKTF